MKETPSLHTKKIEEVRSSKVGEGVERYAIEGDVIALEYKEFSPGIEGDSAETIMFLPGWAAGDAKTLEDLTGHMAEYSGTKTLQIRTRSEAVDSNLEKEARAIRDSIIKRGLTSITLAGHSEGGAKAVELIAILQKENPEINVRGLILMDPVGLYDQKAVELAKNFARDSLIQTPATLLRNTLRSDPIAPRARLLKQGLQASSDIIFNMVREVFRSGVNFPARLRSRVADLGRERAHYKDVQCPVVLMQGADDPVSSHERVLPDDPGTLRERDELVRETFFPSSPRVDMLIPKKLGHHGLPHFRSKQVADVSLYLLDRYWRQRNKEALQQGSL